MGVTLQPENIQMDIYMSPNNNVPISLIRVWKIRRDGTSVHIGGQPSCQLLGSKGLLTVYMYKMGGTDAELIIPVMLEGKWNQAICMGWAGVICVNIMSKYCQCEKMTRHKQQVLNCEAMTHVCMHVSATVTVPYLWYHPSLCPTIFS